jgi:STE24 endopeptidase
MENNPPKLDPSRQKRAKEYARVKRRLLVFELLVGAAYLTLWVTQAWGLQLQKAIAGAQLAPNLPWWGELLSIAIVLGAGWQVLTLPLDYYVGYILPHHYNLSNQTFLGWITDLFKSTLITLLLGVPLLLGLYSLIRFLPETWWIWAASGFSLITVVLAILAPVLLMPIFFTLEPLNEKYAALKERLIELAQKAKTQVTGVYRFDMSRRTKVANAALAGLGRTRRILLADTLLTNFSDDEIETILAHELGHHVHKDIPFQILIQSGLNFIAFYIASVVLEAWTANFGLAGAYDPAGLPLLGVVFGVLGLITMPLTNALSRWRETMADDYALKLSDKPLAFASAMTRLANQNLADVDPHRWVVWLLYSHPPLRDRILNAKTFYDTRN